MEDVKIRVIDSDKLVNAINEGSYDVNLSSVMALGAVMLDTKKLSPAPPEEHTLPPAQPERKKGKWIKNDNGTYSCNLCHSWIPEEQHYYAQFCLYCGADMRGEPNETD